MKKTKRLFKAINQIPLESIAYIIICIAFIAIASYLIYYAANLLFYCS